MSDVKEENLDREESWSKQDSMPLEDKRKHSQRTVVVVRKRRCVMVGRSKMGFFLSTVVLCSAI